MIGAETGLLRVGNASGFYGDRASAVREMLEGGELDVLTGDYLAELTMLILGRDRQRDPELGYARSFLRQMEDCLALAVDRGVRVVVNAGGLNPAGLASALRELADRLGVRARVAHVEGDDLLSRAGELGLGRPLAANAYLGAWGIAACLRGGADVVVTGRVTDASLVVGPAVAHFGWEREDFDRIAGAMAAGHVLECGTQATGGNYAFFAELARTADLTRPGFPLAELRADGSSVVTKHPGTGGAVTVGTVTAQLVYEVGGPRYAGPDAVLRLDSVELTQLGPDRVGISGVCGEAPPPTSKVSLNSLGGFRNETEFVLTGLDVEAKADLVRRQLESWLPVRPRELRWTLARLDRPDAPTQEQASALLRCVARDPDPKKVGRAFSATAVELALASYPGACLTEAPGEGSPYGVFTAAYVDAALVPHVAVLPDGSRVEVSPAPVTAELKDDDVPDLEPEPSREPDLRRVPLGLVAGARSGDKGGDANIGVWVRSDAAWDWLARTLTVAELRRMLPEAAELPVRRHLFPNLRAVNFVVEGILGEGVAAKARFDPQAKGLGEWLRSRHVDVPACLLDEPGREAEARR